MTSTPANRQSAGLQRCRRWQKQVSRVELQGRFDCVGPAQEWLQNAAQTAAIVSQASRTENDVDGAEQSVVVVPPSGSVAVSMRLEQSAALVVPFQGMQSPATCRETYLKRCRRPSGWLWCGYARRAALVTKPAAPLVGAAGVAGIRRLIRMVLCCFRHLHVFHSVP